MPTQKATANGAVSAGALRRVTIVYDDGHTQEVAAEKPLVIADAAELVATESGDMWNTFRTLWVAAGRPDDPNDLAADKTIRKWLDTVDHFVFPESADVADPPTVTKSAR